MVKIEKNEVEPILTKVSIGKCSELLTPKELVIFARELLDRYDKL